MVEAAARRESAGEFMIKSPCYCSFCGRTQAEVEVMVAGPAHVFICDNCVADAIDAIAKKRADDAADAAFRKLIKEAEACAGCIPEPIHG